MALTQGFSLGICDYWEVFDDEYHELGIKYFKQPIGHTASVEEIREAIRPGLKARLKPILDLRTDGEFVRAGILHTCENCKFEVRFALQLANCPRCGTVIPVLGEAECHTIVADHDDKFVKWFAEVVNALWEQVAGFEVWGEPQCPILTGGALPPPRLAWWLKEVAKRVPAGATLTNGGLGIGPWKDCELQQLFQSDALKWCQALNLHPFSFQGNPHVQAKLYDWMLAMCEFLMRKHTLPRLPIIATEFGYPSGVGAWEGSLLASGTLPIQIEAVPERLQADIMDASLKVLAKYDVGPVCLFTRDIDNEERPNFWGFHCGWLRSDHSPKPLREVVKKWGQRKGLREVAKKWGQRKGLREVAKKWGQRKVKANHQDGATRFLIPTHS